MRSPTTALLWEIRRQKGWLLWLVLALISIGWLFNALWGGTFRATEEGRRELLTIDAMLACASIFLVSGIFHYTEFNPQKQWTGFPYHLFTFPVRTWRLVALPMLAGLVAAELTYLAWVKLIFVHNELVRPIWFAVLIGSYSVFFQTILWTLAGFRILRIVVLSVVGTSLVGVAFMPFFSQLTPKWWLSQRVLTVCLGALALLAYLTAWNVVFRQRTGGGVRENWLKKQVERVFDLFPKRRSAFASAAAAQFWFEWRRCGLLLPTLVAAVLLLVIGPLSWHLRDEAAIVLWILPQTLAMPVVLAAAISKGFSKPDFWSANLALPSFIATRPMATGEMVVAKLKAAALSAAVAWALVFAFLCLWLPLWAKVDQLSMLRIGFWMVYGHSVYPQYAIAALILAAGILLTWRFLVGGLCVGLSGNRKLFVGSASVYCLAAILGITSFAWLLNNDQQFMAWVRHDPNKLLRIFEWAAGVAIIAKSWLAASSWRRISGRRTWRYLVLWAGATWLLITLAKLIWADGCLTLSLMSALDFLPLDPYRLEYFLILMGLLALPLARLGFAPSALARNRHGEFRGEGCCTMSKPLAALAILLSVVAILLARAGEHFIRVNAGGPSLRMLKTGAGEPTVVFESGSGSPLETWVRVQPEVSRFAHTISYDRAGNGLSEKGPVPRDGARIASELHAALANSRAQPPYILVGHSLGGPYIRIFAGMYPQEVAGMVLVDPTQEELIEWAKARDPEPQRAPRLYDEVDCAPSTFAQARTSRIPAGIPLVLISGMGPLEIPGFLPPDLKAEVQKDQQTFYPAKLRFHREWADKIPSAKLIITKKSGHGIPFEEPELIVNAIRQVVQRVNKPQGSASQP